MALGDFLGGVNRVLHRHSGPALETRPSASSRLPEWCSKGAKLQYISKSRGDAHMVEVEKIEEKMQAVLIRFEQDRRTWKRVPFREVSVICDGTLRPLWKKVGADAPATVLQKPDGFVMEEVPDSEEEANMAQPVDPAEAFEGAMSDEELEAEANAARGEEEGEEEPELERVDEPQDAVDDGTGMDPAVGREMACDEPPDEEAAEGGRHSDGVDGTHGHHLQSAPSSPLEALQSPEEIAAGSAATSSISQPSAAATGLPVLRSPNLAGAAAAQHTDQAPSIAEESAASAAECFAVDPKVAAHQPQDSHSIRTAVRRVEDIDIKPAEASTPGLAPHRFIAVPPAGPQVFSQVDPEPGTAHVIAFGPRVVPKAGKAPAPPPPDVEGPIMLDDAPPARTSEVSARADVAMASVVREAAVPVRAPTRVSRKTAFAEPDIPRTPRRRGSSEAVSGAAGHEPARRKRREAHGLLPEVPASLLELPEVVTSPSKAHSTQTAAQNATRVQAARQHLDSIVEEGDVTRATLAFKPANAHEASIQPGDEVQVMERHSSGWIFCRSTSAATGEVATGWAPAWIVPSSGKTGKKRRKSARAEGA